MSDVRFLLFVPETVEHMGRATPNEVRQLLANAHVTTDNPASPNSARGERRLLIGRTDGGRSLHYSSAPNAIRRVGRGSLLLLTDRHLKQPLLRAERGRTNTLRGPVWVPQREMGPPPVLFLAPAVGERRDYFVTSGIST